jgi:hypothetical protein
MAQGLIFQSSDAVDRAVACIAFSVLLSFSGWTLIHHLATFGGIPWGCLTAWAWLWSPMVLACALFFAYRLSQCYLEQLPGVQSIRSAHTIFNEPAGKAWIPVGIGTLVLIAVAVALFSHRSDFDDAEYLQLAMQTMSHPQLAPHTFDASLGHLLNQIRFSPYRIASYETLVALVSTLTALPVMTVYYLVLPAFFAGISVLVAYCFLRWFMDAPWALVGLALFLLICLSWGETHTAFGNRYLVRLFQGKGLIVAITTPICLMLGMLLLRRPSGITWIGLTAAHIAALGVSSSGVVTSVVVTAMLFVIALGTSRPTKLKTIVISGALLGSSLAYTLGIALWLRFASAAGGLTPEIGSLLPITTSLGGQVRLSLSFIILALGSWTAARHLWHGTRQVAPDIERVNPNQTEYLLMVVSCLLLALNPLVADFFALISARNMTWRLAWAAPIPLLLALSLLYIFRAPCENLASTASPPSIKGIRAYIFLPGAILASLLLLAFLLGGRWVIAPSNGVRLGWPSPKVPPEYHQAVALNKMILDAHVNLSGTVLVEPRVGTWLTVVNPQLRLVMPGHGYPITLGTILPKQEFDARVALLSFISGSGPQASKDTKLAQYFAQFDVATVMDMNGVRSQSEDFRSELARAGYSTVYRTDIATLYRR